MTVQASHQTDAAIDSLVDELRRRIPSMEQLVAISDPNDMGPDVTIPAIWMSLLLTHIDGLKKTSTLMTLEAAASLPRRPMPESSDDITAYAIDLAHHALATCNAFEVAAGSLFQAAIAILVKKLPPGAVLNAVETLPELFNLRGVVGIGETRQ